MRYLIIRALYALARWLMPTIAAPELLTREDALDYARRFVQSDRR